MISQTAEYALRAIADLAAHYGKPRTTQQIAEATKVPSGYLAKILKDLNRAGLVHSQRGVKGGFTLLPHPDELPVNRILEAVSPLQRIRECPLGLKEHANGNLCPLHRLLDDAMAKVETAFKSVTIGELGRSAENDSALSTPTSELPVTLRIDRDGSTASDGSARRRPTPPKPNARERG